MFINHGSRLTSPMHSIIKHNRLLFFRFKSHRDLSENILKPKFFSLFAIWIAFSVTNHFCLRFRVIQGFWLEMTEYFSYSSIKLQQKCDIRNQHNEFYRNIYRKSEFKSTNFLRFLGGTPGTKNWKVEFQCFDPPERLNELPGLIYK